MPVDAITIALCSIISALVTSDVKTWTKNTNYDDPTNWNGAEK